MSELAREFFAHNPALTGPLIAMVLFTAVFVIAAVRAFSMRTDKIHRLANLALDDENQPASGEVTAKSVTPKSVLPNDILLNHARSHAADGSSEVSQS